MSKRIVVTGINIISSLGLNLKSNWQNLCAGKSGAGNITLFDPSNNQTRIAAQLPDDFPEFAKSYVKKRLLKQMSRTTTMGYVCTKELINNEQINFDDFDKTRCAVIMGIVRSEYPEYINQDHDEINKNLIVKGMNNALPAWIAQTYKLEGPAYSISTACSSSTYAIGAAFDLIKYNKADLVITGGADSTINPYEIKGFNDIFALSTNNEFPKKASKPFSIDRDGFLIGEGSGVLILESEESALKRNAEIYGEIPGYALTCEAYNIMAPMKNGKGMEKTMNIALKSANLNINDIDYINAHGTSTILNDKYETTAIKNLFCEKAYKIPVTSSKSMTGHTIGAAGAIESIITLMSINNNIITPTINYDHPDPELDLDYVPNRARKKEINYAISNSFAFGGHNGTIVLKKYK